MSIRAHLRHRSSGALLTLLFSLVPGRQAARLPRTLRGPGLRSGAAGRWLVSDEPNLDPDDPAQRCHRVLVRLKRHAPRSGLAENRVDSLHDAVEGEFEAGGVVRWVWKEVVAVLRATSIRGATPPFPPGT